MHNCVALCIGDAVRPAPGVGMVSMMMRRSSQTAEGMCHVFPKALFRWYSILSCVMFVPAEAHQLFSHSRGCQVGLAMLVLDKVLGLVLPWRETLVICLPPEDCVWFFIAML